MNCGGRIYKGEDITVSIPFAISGYSDLVVSYFTNGDVHVDKTEEELVIDGGYAFAEFDNTELDILEDGVLRYTITCKVDGEDYVYSNNTPYYLKTPKDYDAKTAEEVWDEGYESGYTEGYPSGVTDGFAIGYPSGVTDGFAIGYPSGRTDGYAEGEVVGKAEGYVSGYTAGEAVGIEEGEAAQKAKLISTAITENGLYEREDGFNRVEVDVNPKLISKNVRLQNIVETIIPDAERPVGISGRTVYGGSIETWKSLIDQYYRVRINQWYPDHSDYIVEGFFQNVDGVYMYYNYQWDVPFPFDDIPASWTDTSSGNHIDLYSDGENVYFTVDFDNGFFFNDGGQNPLDPSVLLFPSSMFYGMSAVTADATNIFNSGHTSGVTDGYAEAYPIGFSDGHASGVTEQKAKLGSISIYTNGTYSRPDGYSNVTVDVRSDIRDCQIGLGFYGPTNFRIGDDRDRWDRSVAQTKLSYYINKIVIPEIGYTYEFDSWTEPDSVSHAFGEGYHTIWLELNEDMPTYYDWISIRSGETYSNVNVIKADNTYEWEDTCLTYGNPTTDISFYNPSTDIEQLLNNLYNF